MENVYPVYEPTRDVVHDLNCKYRGIKNIHVHFHQAIEITCILSGEVDFYIDGKCKRLQSGDVAFAPPYSVHYAKSDCAVEGVVLIIPKLYFDEFIKFTGGATYSFLTDKKKNKDIITIVRAIADRGEDMPSVLSKGYANVVLGLILDRYEPEKSANTNQNLVMQIIKYLDEHYRENITLEQISAHFGYSKYYFSRLFNRLFSCNLNTYVNSLRMRAVDSDKSGENKSKVIEDAGFSSLSSYYRCKK